MSFGVEHTRWVGIWLEKYKLDIPLMPFGVEHLPQLHEAKPAKVWTYL